MNELSPSLQHRAASLILVVNLVALAACSSSTGSTAMAPTLEPRDKGASSSNYITVDDTSCTGTCANEIAGINDSRNIVGNYSSCTSHSVNPCNGANWECNPSTGNRSACQPCPLRGGANVWHSYTSTYTSGYSAFADVQYPDAPQGQYMYAISDAPISPNSGASPPPGIQVGCINAFAGDPNQDGEEKGHWALLNYSGLWSVHDPGGAAGCDSGNIHDKTEELLGYDLTNAETPTAVGFYSYNSANTGTPVCSFIPAELQAGDNWKKLTVNLGSFAAVNVMATGITGSGTATKTGDIVGIATTNGKTSSQVGYQVAWYSLAPGTTYSYRGAIATAFTGIASVNGVMQIVGWYTLPASVGQAAATHGFVATPGTSHGSVTYSLQPINIGTTLTMVNGINSLGDICGWYADSSGTYHGFVWLGKAAAALRKSHRHHSVTNRDHQVSSVAVPLQQTETIH